MLISKAHKFIFVHIPKTGGSAMHVWFKDYYQLKGEQRADPEPHVHHSTMEEIVSSFPDVSDYYKFAVTRNPWDRLVSGYYDFTQNRKRHYSGKIILEKPLLSEYKDFNEFCIDFPNSKWKDEIHFKPQNLFIKLNNANAMNYTGRQENLEEDFGKILLELGIVDDNFLEEKKKQNKVFLEKHRSSNHKHYRDCYTNQTKKIIGDFFEEDINMFEYNF